jgi:uncharacterized membrane protein YbhN (UPF0104 family)
MIAHFIQKFKTTAIIALKISFVFLAFYLVFQEIDIEDIISQLEGVSISWLVLAFVFSNISLIFSGLRSQVYFEQFGLKISKSFSVMLYYIGTFFNVVLPGGITGDGYKVFAIAKHYNFSKIKALRVILYERVNGFYVLGILCLICVYFSDFANIQHVNIINTILLVAITPCYAFGIKYVLRDRFDAVVKATTYSFVVQILQVLMALSIMKAFDVDFMPYMDLLVLFIAGSILCVLPISIGGIGMRELTFLYGAELLGSLSPELSVSIGFLSFIIYAATALI